VPTGLPLRITVEFGGRHAQHSVDAPEPVPIPSMGPTVGDGMTAVELIGPGRVPLLARPYFADGDPGPIVAALAQVPELLTVAVPFLGAVLGASAIDARTKEIVIVRTSALADCEFCTRSHTTVALDAGLSTVEVRALRGLSAVETSGTVFNAPRDIALLGWVDAVAGGRGPVAPGVSTALSQHWADHEIVELTLLIGATLMLNRFATALELPTAPDVLARLGAEDLL